MSRVLRYAVFSALALHILWRLAIPELVSARDLFLYNAIWLLTLLWVLAAPLSFNRIALSAIALSLFFWGIGSLATSFSALGDDGDRYSLLAQLSYLPFYPLLLIAIPRLATVRSRLSPLETLDALIFGLGFTSVASTVLVTFIFPPERLFQSADYFTLFYAVGDIALVLLMANQLITRGFTRERILFGIGVVIFAATDIYYLWLTINRHYSFAAIAEDGWLLAFAVIALAVSIESKSETVRKPIHPALIAISIFISPILLALSALRPNLFPIYIVALLVANLLLAFIRMSTALREAKILSDERILARTDELTGLANRRKLLSELENFSTTEGALMLLDLDGFKPINDQYGHDVGDLILRDVAARFRRLLPQGSVLARLGGDEFGIIYKGRYEEALESAYALRASLSYPFTIAGAKIHVGVSIGVVENDGAGDLLKRADSAMYRAKQMETGVDHS
jgi:diguanylate cyclase (GGDEF)-like protein